MLPLLVVCESNERGNNCGPTDERDAISGNRSCHFTQTNSPFKTAAFALGQLRDPGQVRNQGFFFFFFFVELSLRLILTKFDNFLTSTHKTLINEGRAEQGDRGGSHSALNR